MRRIQELLQDGKKVWFYLKDKEAERKFVEELNHIGARYLNGSPVTTENCSPIMAVHPDLRVAHLMIMIWNTSFSPNFQKHYSGDVTKIMKVDYAKYINGEEDFICVKSDFIPAL